MATIYGTQGNDSLPGTLEDDTISGLSGNDTLVGLAGNDLLTADQQSLTGSTAGVNYMVNPGIRPDEDVVIGGSGNDTLVGGVGSYTLADYSTVLSDSAGAATQGIVVNMQAGTVVDNWGNTDTLLSVDAIKGSPLADLFTASSTLRSNFDGGDGNDTLVGGNHWDDLRGGAGNDSLSGGGEDDSLAGGPGNDLLDGSAGLYDLADYSAFYDPTNGYILHGVVANLTTGLATDGWGGTDTLVGIEMLISIQT